MRLTKSTVLCTINFKDYKCEVWKPIRNNTRYAPLVCWDVQWNERLRSYTFSKVSIFNSLPRFWMLGPSQSNTFCKFLASPGCQRTPRCSSSRGTPSSGDNRCQSAWPWLIWNQLYTTLFVLEYVHWLFRWPDHLFEKLSQHCLCGWHCCTHMTASYNISCSPLRHTETYIRFWISGQSKHCLICCHAEN